MKTFPGAAYRLSMLVFLFCFNVYPGLSAQFTAVDDKNAVMERLAAQSATLKSIQADFSQEKKLDFLDETIVSRGKFWFRTENDLRWAYEHPFAYAIVFHRGNFYIIDEDQVSSFDIESNAAFREINSLIVGMVRGNVMREDKFSIRISESTDQYLVQMQPLDQTMAGIIANMEIYFGKHSLLVDKIVMKESQDDYTVITFTGRSINEDIPDSVFSAGL